MKILIFNNVNFLDTVLYIFFTQYTLKKSSKIYFSFNLKFFDLKNMKGFRKKDLNKFLLFAQKIK